MVRAHPPLRAQVLVLPGKAMTAVKPLMPTPLQVVVVALAQLEERPTAARVLHRASRALRSPTQAAAVVGDLVRAALVVVARLETARLALQAQRIPVVAVVVPTTVLAVLVGPASSSCGGFQAAVAPPTIPAALWLVRVQRLRVVLSTTHRIQALALLSAPAQRLLAVRQGLAHIRHPAI